MPSTVRKQPAGWMPLLLLVAAFIVIYLLWNVFLVFILAALFALFVYPLVKLFDRRLPHPLALISVYLLIIIIFMVLLGLLTPLVTAQVSQLVANIPAYAGRAHEISNKIQHHNALPPVWRTAGHNLLIQIQQSIVRTAQQLLPLAVGFFGNLVTLIFIPLLAFFMLMNPAGYKQMIMVILPPNQRKRADDLLECIGDTMWNFFKAELLLMLAVGTLDGVGLYIVGMPYAAVFAILAGLMEVIPSLGPMLTTLTVAIAALLINPALVLKATLVPITVQILENIFLVPVVMGRTVGLNPVTVAFSILLGGKIAGVPGAIIAVPLAMLTKVIILYFYSNQDQATGGKRKPVKAARKQRRKRILRANGSYRPQSPPSSP